jgi:hypothetical protein
MPDAAEEFRECGVERRRRLRDVREQGDAGLRHGLDHPRWLYVLPNGDVLVAETNAPPKPAAARASRAGSWGW